jgi:stearoyl-CoA desaturase (delta-9 desaturase)
VTATTVSPPTPSPSGGGGATEQARPSPVPRSVVEQAATAAIVSVPLAGVAVAAWAFWGTGIGVREVVLAAFFYVATAAGIGIGYHRLVTHRSFEASRPVKLAFTVAGAMAFQGGPVGWAHAHRVHHLFSDREGDPHSPVTGSLLHAHLAWLFRPSRPLPDRLATDLRADADLRWIDRLFPLWCVASLGLPFLLGWAWGGTVAAGWSAFLWAGLVRVALLQHVTWSVNSICHRFGRRPNATPDRSGNVAFLALASLGESWHNNHHARPRSARHGGPGQWDISAGIIRVLERAGLVRAVRWPT